MSTNSTIFSKLFRSVGRYSRYAGLGFIALSILFLVLAVSNQFIVFEVDSIVAFLVAIFLLFRDPRARVQARVLDAILLSSDQTIEELAVSSKAGFAYVPAGNNVEDVVVVPAGLVKATMPNGAPTSEPSLVITPPGRELARLYNRETGLTHVTMDALRISLSEMMRENFGLARSVSIDSKDDIVRITLHGASATCTCGSAGDQAASAGRIGCTLASFLAVLVATATERSTSLEPCVHDTSADNWVVSMSLGQGIVVSK